MKTALKRIKTILMWIIIGILSFYLLKYVAPIAFIIGAFMLFYKKTIGIGLDDLAIDLRKVNYTLDLLGNVTIFNWLWFLFKSKDGYKFGKVRETISYVLKVNYEQGTLRYLGKSLYNIINKLDPGHFDNLKF
jgi:hypothetical protein